MNDSGESRPQSLLERWRVAIGLLGLLVVAATAYLVGAATAPTAEDESAEREAAYGSAYKDAHDSSLVAARKRGSKAGAAQGRRLGRIAGAEDGASSGDEGAGEELAALEAAERARNCGAPLFRDGYCPTDEEIAYENNAESLCGGGDYEEAAAQGIDCGPGTYPRP